MDAMVGEEGKGKKRKVSITPKNFGSYMDISKVKSATTMVLVWRCRWVFKTLLNKLTSQFHESWKKNYYLCP